MNKDQLIKLIELKMMAERQTLIKGEKGDKGETPKFGVDYWTEDQINSVVTSVLEHVNELVEEITPRKGVNYFTEQEISTVIENVKSSLSNGKDAIVDYEKINQYVDSIIPEAESVDYSKVQLFIDEQLRKIEPETGMDIVSKINELPTTPEHQIDASHIKNLPVSTGTGVVGPRNIKNMISAGAGTSLTGSGSITDPYVINASEGGSIVTTAVDYAAPNSSATIVATQPVTITLPAVTSTSIKITISNQSTGEVTVIPTGSDLVHDDTSLTISLHNSTAQLQSISSLGWVIV
jgi:hypothetical protein